jgi:hypothetical protein
LHNPFFPGIRVVFGLQPCAAITPAKETTMSLLLTIMLISALPFPILATMKLADRYYKTGRVRPGDGGEVSAR